MDYREGPQRLVWWIVKKDDNSQQLIKKSLEIETNNKLRNKIFFCGLWGRAFICRVLTRLSYRSWTTQNV